MKKRGIGLAFGGGSVKGFAHIGVLKVLEKNNIKISHIAGTSIGAAVGAIYSAGYKAKELEDFVLDIDWPEMIDISFPPKEGLLQGKELEKVLKNVLKNKTFKKLKIPFAATAVNLISGETLIFNQGNVAKAVRASISYPGFFVPVHYKNMLLIDGGILTPIPVNAARKIGAKKVLAVDLKQKRKENVFLNMFKEYPNEKDSFKKEFKQIIFQQELEEINHYLKEKKIKLPFYVKILLRSSKIRGMVTKKVKIPDIIRILFRSVQVMGDKLSAHSLKEADIIIKPKLKKINYLEFDKIPYIIKSGEKTAQQNIRKIKKLIK